MYVSTSSFNKAMKEVVKLIVYLVYCIARLPCAPSNEARLAEMSPPQEVTVHIICLLAFPFSGRFGSIQVHVNMRTVESVQLSVYSGTSLIRTLKYLAAWIIWPRSLGINLFNARVYTKQSLLVGVTSGCFTYMYLAMVLLHCSGISESPLHIRNINQWKVLQQFDVYSSKATYRKKSAIRGLGTRLIDVVTNSMIIPTFLVHFLHI